MTTESLENRPKPRPDALTEPYWNAVNEQQFKLPFCESCGRAHFYPRSFCPHCGSDSILWKQAGGRGTVYSCTTVHRAPGPAFASAVPYVVALVALEEGPHLMTSIVGCDPAEVQIGMPVMVDFLDIGAATLPVFRPISTDRDRAGKGAP